MEMESKSAAECLDYSCFYKIIKYVGWTVFFLFVICILLLDVAVTMLATHHSSSCDARLAQLNMTSVCGHYCRTMYAKG